MRRLCFENQFSFILKLELIIIKKTFTLGLALKERLRETRKWPITAKFLKAKFSLSNQDKALNTSTQSWVKMKYLLLSSKISMSY